MKIYPATKSCVDDKLEYNVVPIYTEEEKKMMGDIPTYNFDSMIEYYPDNPNPKILFSNTYNHNEMYRSMFALTENQVHGLINLLQESLDALKAKKEEHESLDAQLKIVFDSIYSSFYSDSCCTHDVVIQYSKSSIFLLEIYRKDFFSYHKFVKIESFRVSIDDEVYNFFQSKKELKDFKFDDEFKNSIIEIFKIKFAEIITDHCSEEFKEEEKEEFFNYAYDDIVYQVVSLPEDYFMSIMEKVLDERKKAMEDVNKFLENMKKQNESSFQNAILTTPAPIQNMSKEEMNKISREFLQSIETEE